MPVDYTETLFSKKMVFVFFFLFKFALKTFCFLSSTINENDKNLLQNSHYESISSVPGMDDAEFRRRGKEMIDYIADYLKHIRYDSISKINDEFISFLFCFDIKKKRTSCNTGSRTRLFATDVTEKCA